jgi:glycosyltransferase involved in cell wall biosynthesis
VALRVLHLSTYAGGGGAGRAAAALNEALQKAGVDSRLVSAHGTRFKAARAADRALWRLQRSETKTWRSPARFGSLSASEINASSADVVNLHWVTDGFMSIEEIGKINKPLVMSIYDMWPFCGSEHYGVDSLNARWKVGYTRENRSPHDKGLDIDRTTWIRKKTHWEQFHLVSASTWMTAAVRQSALMSHWPISQVPHAVDPQKLLPKDKTTSRQQLGIKIRGPIIAFFSSAGVQDKRKGYDLLAEAMRHVQVEYPDVCLLVVGPKSRPQQGFPDPGVLELGPAHGDHDLTLAYSAADVLAVPSREDNMPLTAMEAQMSGRPVVAFNIGGLPDIVHHNETGFLARPLDTTHFATGILRSLSATHSGQEWGKTARQRAVATWGSQGVASKYIEIYQNLLT